MSELNILGHDINNTITIAQFHLTSLITTLENKKIQIDGLEEKKQKIFLKLEEVSLICKSMMGEQTRPCPNPIQTAERILFGLQSDEFKTYLQVNSVAELPFNQVEWIRIICNLSQNSIEAGAKHFGLKVSALDLVFWDDAGGIHEEKIINWRKTKTLPSSKATNRLGIGLHGLVQICTQHSFEIELFNGFTPHNFSENIGLNVRLIVPLLKL